MDNINQISILEDNSYSVHINNFDGPFDLLWDLVKQAKMDINEIKLSEITDQYLDYINTMERLDMDNVSEFIEIAATLIEIKSKKLLPRVEDELPDEEDPEQVLLRRMQEHRMLKEAAQEMKPLEEVNRLFKEPEPNAKKYKIVLKDMVLDALLDAFTVIMQKTIVEEKTEEPKKIVRDRFTVAEKISAIKDALLIKKQLKFNQLFEKTNTKSEVINVFLAILELLKLQIIKVNQDTLYGEIEIVSADEPETETLNVGDNNE